MEPGPHRQFIIHECLGRGGFGEVYRATMVSQGGLKTKVALKLLRTDVDPRGDATNRLRDEGRLLAALHHPSILRAYDLALVDGRIGLVTEYVDGVDLSHLVGILHPRALMRVIDGVAEALDAVWNGFGHDRTDPLRLVHRDIKPSNIRISRHGEVKLLDFGIARSDEVDREAHTGTGSAIGSLSYMAPERFSRRSPGPAADIYALGVTLFEVLVGERFHADAIPVEMFRLAANPEDHGQHVEAEMARLPPEARPLEGLIREMLHHDPDARISAGEVAVRCEALFDTLPGPTLKRWAKGWTWPPSEGISGGFEGRTITEGSLVHTDLFAGVSSEAPTDSSATYAIDLLHSEPALPTVEESARQEPARWRSALLLIPLLGLFTMGGWLIGTPDPPPPPMVVKPVPLATSDPKPVEVLVEVPVPVEVPKPVPVPVEVPKPVEVPVPVPKPVEVPKPVPVEPAPIEVPVPVDVPVPVEMPPEPVVGTLQVQADGMDVEFRSAAGRFRTGKVPVGTYVVYINGSNSRSKVEVTEGIVTYVTCSRYRVSCSSE